MIVKKDWIGGAVVLLVIALLSSFAVAHATPKGPLSEADIPAGSYIVADHFIKASELQADDISHPLSPAVLASLHLPPAVAKSLDGYRGYHELITAQSDAGTVLTGYTYLYNSTNAAQAAEEAALTLFKQWKAAPLPDAAPIGYTFRQEGEEGPVYWLILREENKLSLLLFDGLDEEAIRQLYEATVEKLQS